MGNQTQNTTHEGIGSWVDAQNDSRWKVVSLQLIERLKLCDMLDNANCVVGVLSASSLAAPPPPAPLHVRIAGDSAA